MDYKYSINGLDLVDVWGLANDEKPRWILTDGTQKPTPPAFKGGVLSAHGQRGSTLPGNPLTGELYIPMAIMVTDFGDPNSELELDSVRALRENTDLLKSFIYRDGYPLIRYYPWMPTNMEIPALNTEGLPYFFYYEAKATLVKEPEWVELGQNRGVLKLLFKVPQGYLGSRWLNAPELVQEEPDESVKYFFNATQSYLPQDEVIVVLKRKNDVASSGNVKLSASWASSPTLATPQPYGSTNSEVTLTLPAHDGLSTANYYTYCLKSGLRIESSVDPTSILEPSGEEAAYPKEANEYFKAMLSTGTVTYFTAPSFSFHKGDTLKLENLSGESEEVEIEVMKLLYRGWQV